MNRILGWTAVGVGTCSAVLWQTVTIAAQPLYLAYPPNNHETTSDRIFLIGTAPPDGEVLVNDRPIQRSTAGHFAPTFPLQVGENLFTLRYQSQTIQLKVTRQAAQSEVPTGLNFAKDSLTPAADIAHLPGESICFGAIAPPQAQVSVKLGNQTIPLQAQTQAVNLPENSAVLTQQNQPSVGSAIGQYQGCTIATTPGNLGQPQFQLSSKGASTIQAAPGKVTILAPNQLEVAEVTAEAGTARTGPSTDYSRLTPLPKGSRAAVTGREGDWLRLDYGAWINQKETRLASSAVPPRSLIRSISSRQVPGWTEVVFPLQTPVPVSVQQGDRTFTLNLFNTTAQTDTIYVNPDRLISRLDWQQVAPTQVQYTLHLKSDQQWGYKLRYEGTSLVLSLRHPPQTSQKSKNRSLQGITILLDPGHGSPNDLGSKGPTGYPEKDVTLVISKLVREQLLKRGATVYMTREGDEDLYPQDRVNQINKLEPAIALSLHYNALPDNGDAIKTKGVSTFWYNPQANSLAVFLHDYLVEKLDRPSYGVYWNNLALTRPTVAPSVLLELGFMINPEEFEWIVDPKAQQKLAEAIATGITEWVQSSK
ncbi:N-acetylmuramoyl-L-alanine amidase [Trichocoleus desertorum AS-A10]|uniref:N-acetylmuramoyl-L-alanine amidase n=1 Tax=Trichocoleus desertorum TaxID=1481672 RepID=UPI00329689D0